MPNVQVFNNGKPVSPGWQMRAFGCVAYGPKFSGMPKGTPRLPPHEEGELLARLRGQYKIRQARKKELKEAGCESSLGVFTHAAIDGDLLAMSGSLSETMIKTEELHVGGNGNKKVAAKHAQRRSLRTAVASAWHHQRLTLWRCSLTGICYLDNVGARLVSMSDAEIRIRTGDGFLLILVRVDEPTDA